MENIAIKLTKREKELAQSYEEAVNNREYEKAISLLNELVTIRDDYPVTYLNLGDCYRGLGKVELALMNYEKAQKLIGSGYLLEDGFEDTVFRRVEIAKLEMKARLAYQEARYEAAITYIDTFLQMNPSESKAYILRGLCNEGRNDYNGAIRDYKLAFKNAVSVSVRELLKERMEFFATPIAITDKSKYLKLVLEEMPKRSQLGDKIDDQYYLRFKSIFDGNRKLNEAISRSVDPEFETLRNELRKQAKLIEKSGYRLELIGCDEHGYFLVSDKEIMKRRLKNPDRPYIVIASAMDNETGQERFYKFNVGGSFRVSPLSETEIKTRSVSK